MATRCACIDVGTNTTRLLVAERGPDGLRAIATARAFVPLTDPDPATVQALCAVVADQTRLAHEHGAARVRLVGTAALRAAPGACEALRCAGGPALEVLDGRAEAALAFRGAIGTLPEPPRAVVAVVDVGGGSTEVAVGTADGGVSWSCSLPVGSATLTAAHVHADPPAAPELDALRAAARDALAGIAPPPVAAAYAVGGSAASLPRMVGARITAASADGALVALAGGACARVAARHGLDARRVRLLPAGIVLLAQAAHRLGTPLLVARGGLREGVVLDALDGPATTVPGRARLGRL